MTRCMPFFRNGLSLLVLFGAEARTETKEDEGLWLMLAGQGGFEAVRENPSDFRWWLDIQPRYFNAGDGLVQTLVRPGVGYAFADNAAAWLGYAWIVTERENAGSSEEHRIWQQLTWSPEGAWLNLSSRTRLEQRFLKTGDDVGWRFRQFFKGTRPIAADSRLYLSVYDEVFVDLNDTDWGQRSGISQNRLFLGLGWKFGSSTRSGPASLEVGYLNQFINRPRVDRMNHILSINLFLNF
jgi:Protein of unknown function (DUF2490)